MHILLKEDLEREALADIGQKLLQEKKIAVVTLAGGSGSRLGYDKPKGTFVLETARSPRLSLFQRQAKQIIPAGMPWVLMVSNETMHETIEHLQKKVLSEQDEVFVIVQQDVEALDLNNRSLLLDANNAPITVPNGNGCVFKALRAGAHICVRKSAISHKNTSIVERLSGVKYFNVVSVDNVLVKIGDPVMAGYAQTHSLEVTSAGIPEPENKKMGVFEVVKNKIAVREYTYDSSDSQPVVNAKGAKLSNIANHLISKEYIQSISVEDIPQHEAIKKIPCKANMHPTAPNAIKRELFIFDGFQWAQNHGVVEYEQSAYEGLKNKEGDADSVKTCIQALDMQ
ncbi:UDP-N-acetylglucosamine/UDP-N-acetylgalactosamine diphosphorylase [Nematocida major]|uniref:UDP-N-acetylglucosamine/UDP-N- acetylgalactosamine diphosphorylase n=1 Tax=Nematocida major TaxID=1912982 RepID=UPI0020086647|nr:UDP-N-acetylglucosamine/UDP-N-acetylgalactosamine diphosphorylase [Nematocida major]KAH9386241.1 UDP-N-acetylglucosamine/UDP-N-acetylgalactosamine diphosphorylase [Nematocida major]